MLTSANRIVDPYSSYFQSGNSLSTVLTVFVQQMFCFNENGVINWCPSLSTYEQPRIFPSHSPLSTIDEHKKNISISSAHIYIEMCWEAQHKTISFHFLFHTTEDMLSSHSFDNTSSEKPDFLAHLFTVSHISHFVFIKFFAQLTSLEYHCYIHWCTAYLLLQSTNMTPYSVRVHGIYIFIPYTLIL